jgi:hypothetical protein
MPRLGDDLIDFSPGPLAAACLSRISLNRRQPFRWGWDPATVSALRHIVYAAPGNARRARRREGRRNVTENVHLR